jgi:hypothetical protein
MLLYCDIRKYQIVIVLNKTFNADPGTAIKINRGFA